jgi:hypothetical protein
MPQDCLTKFIKYFIKENMNNRLFVILFLVINATVFSNDSRTILGSSVEIIDNENTNVIMQDEEINIVLYKDYYEVTVIFDFYNDGPVETILLGFPVRTVIQNYPDDKEWAIINDFKTYINGNLLSEYTVKEESSQDRGYITTTKWFLREVTFPGNNHTYSKITYKSPYNNSGFFKNAGYIYGTGGNWKGTIRKMSVIINHEDDIIIDSVNFGNDKPFDFIWEANGKYKYILENIEPERSDRIVIYVQPFDIYGKYHNEFGNWAEGWGWDKYLMYNNITDIKLYTKNQIRLFINFFYAIHGYDFKNLLYKEYFQRLRSFVDYNNTKYKVNPDFSENDFNEFERKNIDYLLIMEKMIP